MSVKRRIIDAALAAYGEPGQDNRRFADVCDAAGVMRGSAYRVFPAGSRSVLCAIHRDTVFSITSAIARQRAELQTTNVEFHVALAQGVRGAIDGLRDSEYCQRVLRRRGDLAVVYLLSKDAGGLFDILSGYAAKCAATFGADGDDMARYARDFVWAVLTTLLRDVPDPGTETEWPSLDDAALAQLVDGPIREFALRVRISTEAKRLGEVVPVVAMPAEEGTGLPSVLVDMLH